MGACSSRPPAVVIGDKNVRGGKVECQCCQEASTDKASDPSVGSQTTGLTRRDSSLLEVVDGGASSTGSAHPEDDDDPAGPAGIPAVVSPDFSDPPPVVPTTTPPPDDGGEGALRQGARHRRKKSGLLTDYLQAEGAASNRIMVRIETPFGIPIEDVYDDVHTGEVLGLGIAGKVRRITHRDTGIQRAVKRLDLTPINTDEDLDRLLDEIKIMCCLDHPNVVCLEEVFEGENELFLTQELCEGGDLFDRLMGQQDEHYTEAACARLVRQIVNSVSYLHSKDIIHRDLKLENFLFSGKGDSEELKMIDFGLSKHFVKGEVVRDAVGTPYTIAPEVILGRGYDEKCDVWGIGVITYLLLSGFTPFGGDCEDDNLNEVRENILAGEVHFDDPCWDVVSEEAIDFIKTLLVLDPEKRPSASELQDHEWLKTMKRNSSFGSDESLSPTVVDGLVSFKELSTTRKFLREIISYTLQPEQISGLHEEFEKFDVHGTGEISLRCFKEALIANSDRHPLTEAEVEEIFQGLKVRNTDMSIRWHEFIAACLSQCHIDDKNIRLAFDRLDHERKGYITLKDLKSAMDFYGSDSRYDLQSLWVNNVLDYKLDKDHMTYSDFYKLLKLDKEEEVEKEFGGSMPDVLRKSAPSSDGITRTPLARSYVGNEGGLDKETLELLTTPLEEFSGSSHSSSGRCRRHSLGPMSDLDYNKILQEPSVVSNVKAKRDIHNFILEASKRVEEEKRTSELRRTSSVRASISGTKGLFLRRNTKESAPFLRTCSSGASS